MRYTPIENIFFKNNRAKLMSQMKANSLAVINSNDIMPANADEIMPFKQNSDIFYLSGVDQEETILLLFPDAPNPEQREMLFLKETNEHIATWEGNKISKEEAIHLSGIEQVHWIKDFEGLFRPLMFQAEKIYLNTNESPRASLQVQTRDDRFIQYVKEKFPLHQLERLAPLLHRLRIVKDYYELTPIKKATEITYKGFKRILPFTKPGVYEYEIEAEYIHEFARNGCSFAYAPIIASGENACVLHYTQNDQKCQDGDMLLMDVGAKYGNYNADMTRTIPVNGIFTKRQKEVYQAVLHVQREAFKMLVPGNTLKEYHQEIGRIMESELIALGLLNQHDLDKQDSKNPLYKRYFMHGTSHHLGLAVHDVGNQNQPFETGMVFTVEPGIYIREEAIGIRLENDIVVRENGIEDLMKFIPIEIEEIEDLMNS